MKMPTETQLDGVQYNRGYAAYWKTPQPENPWPEGCRNHEKFAEGFEDARAYYLTRRAVAQVEQQDREQRWNMSRDIKAAKQARHKTNKAARADANRARSSKAKK